MEALDILIGMLQKFEGCRLKAYLDWAGVWTIGWGETAGVKKGMVWTQAQADAVLRKRAAEFLLHVLAACPQLLKEPPRRQAACASLAYNIGKAGFSISSVRRKTQRRDYKGAADAFRLWNKANGKVDRILVLRREKERTVYISA